MDVARLSVSLLSLRYIYTPEEAEQERREIVGKLSLLVGDVSGFRETIELEWDYVCCRGPAGT